MIEIRGRQLFFQTAVLYGDFALRQRSFPFTKTLSTHFYLLSTPLLFPLPFARVLQIAHIGGPTGFFGLLFADETLVNLDDHCYRAAVLLARGFLCPLHTFDK